MSLEARYETNNPVARKSSCPFGSVVSASQLDITLQVLGPWGAAAQMHLGNLYRFDDAIQLATRARELKPSLSRMLPT